MITMGFMNASSNCYQKVDGLPPFSSLPQDRLLLPVIWSIINMIMEEIMIMIMMKVEMMVITMRMVEMRVDPILDVSSIQHPQV